MLPKSSGLALEPRNLRFILPKYLSFISVNLFAASLLKQLSECLFCCVIKIFLCGFFKEKLRLVMWCNNWFCLYINRKSTRRSCGLIVYRWWSHSLAEDLYLQASKMSPSLMYSRCSVISVQSSGCLEVETLWLLRSDRKLQITHSRYISWSFCRVMLQLHCSIYLSVHLSVYVW